MGNSNTDRLGSFGSKGIKSGGGNFFKNLGSAAGIISEDQSNLAILFPSMVTNEEALQLESLCTLEDLSSILKAFTKDKSLGPDGWIVDFFLHFFELIGEDLLGMVEESRRMGEVIKALNAIFPVLIPKVNKPSSFSDF
jgi:hypothetical protein